jgi:hypothetical protein
MRRDGAGWDPGWAPSILRLHPCDLAGTPVPPFLLRHKRVFCKGQLVPLVDLAPDSARATPVGSLEQDTGGGAEEDTAGEPPAEPIRFVPDEAFMG